MVSKTTGIPPHTQTPLPEEMPAIPALSDRRAATSALSQENHAMPTSSPEKPDATAEKEVSDTRDAFASGVTTDVFSDLSKLRLPQNFEAVGVTPVLMTVPVRKPKSTEFVRVHLDDQMDAFTLETDDQEIYFVVPECGAKLGDDLRAVTLFRVVTRQGAELLWPVKYPKDGQAPMGWHTSAREAAGLARDHWIRLRSDNSLNAYRVDKAGGDLGEPKWSSNSLQELLRIAFRDRIIDSVDHPVVRRRLGLE
jgi:hypothetical protein